MALRTGTVWGRRDQLQRTLRVRQRYAARGPGESPRARSGRGSRGEGTSRRRCVCRSRLGVARNIRTSFHQDASGPLISSQNAAQWPEHPGRQKSALHLVVWKLEPCLLPCSCLRFPLQGRCARKLLPDRLASLGFGQLGFVSTVSSRCVFDEVRVTLDCTRWARGQLGNGFRHGRNVIWSRPRPSLRP